MSSRRSRRGLTKRPHPWPPRETRPNVLWTEELKRKREFCRELDRRTAEWVRRQDAGLVNGLPRGPVTFP